MEIFRNVLAIGYNVCRIGNNGRVGTIVAKITDQNEYFAKSEAERYDEEFGTHLQSNIDLAIVEFKHRHQHFPETIFFYCELDDDVSKHTQKVEDITMLMQKYGGNMKIVYIVYTKNLNYVYTQENGTLYDFFMVNQNRSQRM